MAQTELRILRVFSLAIKWVKLGDNDRYILKPGAWSDNASSHFDRLLCGKRFLSLSSASEEARE